MIHEPVDLVEIARNIPNPTTIGESTYTVPRATGESIKDKAAATNALEKTAKSMTATKRASDSIGSAYAPTQRSTMVSAWLTLKN